jgi:outer membrane biosynthesis protein TonB
MSGILVVSRNAALAMGLARHDHDVTEVRPDRFGDWVASAESVEGVVLELADAVAAEAAVVRLRSEGYRAPVLVVSGGGPGWDQIADHLGPATGLLPLPLSLPKLLSTLEQLIAAGPAPAGATVAAPAEPVASPEAAVVAEPERVPDEHELLQTVAASIGLSIAESGTLVAGEPQPEPVPMPEPAPEPLPEPAPEPVPEPAPEPPPPAPAPPAPAPAPVPPVPGPGPLPVPPPEPVPGPFPAPTPPLPVGGSSPYPNVRMAPRRHSMAALADVAGMASAQLVTHLSERAQELIGLGECADVVVLELAERTAAEAAAVLLPDGAAWRVAGGHNLRPLEHRIQLDAGSWLVETIAIGGRGLIIEGSDIGRQRLSGSPLASWTHLLAAPLPGLRGVLLAARSAGPFDEAALTAAVALAEEAVPLLQEGMELRTLARQLSAYTDPAD